MRALLLAFLLFALAAVAEPPSASVAARPTIGMTEVGVREKYGKPAREAVEAPSDKVLMFEKNGIGIWAYLKKDRVWKLEYSRRGKLTGAEAETLLANNGGPWTGHVDSNNGRLWWSYRANSYDEATMVALISDDGSLAIKTKEFIEADKLARAARLKGL